MEYGVFVNLEPGVDALTPHMFGRPAMGDRVLMRVVEVRPEKQQIRGRIIRKMA